MLINYKLINLIVLIKFSLIENVMSLWDYAITTNGKIIFYDSKWDQTTTAAHQFDRLSAITYDEIGDTIYFNDENHENGIIFALQLSKENEYNHKIEKIVQKTNHENVHGLAFDPLDRILYWTDSETKHIYKLDLKKQQQQEAENFNNNYSNSNNNNNNINNIEPEIFLKLNNDSQPKGISIDICRRRLYWTNDNHKNATIESVSLAAATGDNPLDHKILISKNLYTPSDIVIDQTSERMYWVDDSEGTAYAVESARLDGQDRRKIVNAHYKQPFNLAVTNEHIYFTDVMDNNVWRISKNPGENDQPISVNKTFETLVKGIIAKTDFLEKHANNINCKDVILKIKQQIADNTKEQLAATAKEIILKNNKFNDKLLGDPQITPSNEIVGNLKEKSPSTTVSSTLINSNKDQTTVISSGIFCFNNGIFNIKTKKCKCPKEYEGANCELSVCHNYCVHGNCDISSTGYPQCTCDNGFTGERCEINLCTGYCLNEGLCILEHIDPVCHCAPNFYGRHCELSFHEMCRQYCANGGDTAAEWNLPVICGDCHDKNNTGNNLLTSSTAEFKHCTDGSSLNKTALFVSGSVMISLLLVFVVIKSARRVYKPLRPKIKKTYVVHKNVNPTPLTSRPTTEQCEITIENCCNMNICDTPCFDPKVLQQEMIKGSKKEKSSDRKTLLNNMEGDLY